MKAAEFMALPRGKQHKLLRQVMRDERIPWQERIKIGDYSYIVAMVIFTADSQKIHKAKMKLAKYLEKIAPVKGR